MGNRRAQVQRNLGLNRGVAGGQRAQDLFSQPNITGQRREFTDLAPLSNALANAVAQKQIEKEQAAAAAGRAAALDTGLSEAVEGAIAAEGAGGTLEEQRKRNQAAFAKLANQGVIPEAANPHFQIALQTGTARRLAGKARRNLMSRVDEFANLNDEEGNPIEPPSVDALIAEEFGQLEGNFAVQSRYGSQAFTAVREGVEEEFRTRVAQVRTEALTREGRRNALNEIVTGTEAEVGLADLAVADEVTPDMLEQLSSQLTRHHDAGVRDVRGLFIEGLSIHAAEVAEDDPDRALRLIRQAEQVRVGPELLGADARASTQLADLRRDLQDESEARAAREFAAADRKRGQIVSLASGRVNAALIAAADSGASMLAAERQALAEIRADEELRGIASDLSPGQLQATLGDVATSARRIRRALEEDSATSDKSLLNQIDVMRAEGLDAGAIQAVIDRGLEQGQISGRDAITLQDAIDGDAQAARVTQASPAFQRIQSRIGPRSIPDNLGTEAQAGLRVEQQELQSWIDESVRGLVRDTTNPAERQGALNEFMASEAAQARITEYESRVTQASRDSAGTAREIDSLIRDNDFEAAESKLAEAERDGLISPRKVSDLRETQRRTREALGRQVNNSEQLRTASRATVLQVRRAAIEANPNLNDTDLDAIEADVLAQFRSGASQGIRDATRGVPPEQQETALASLGEQIRTGLVSQFRTGEQRAVEGEEALVTEERLTALTNRRIAKDARDSLARNSTAGAASDYRAFVPTELVDGVPEGAYNLKTRLDGGEFRGGILGFGGIGRPEQRSIMQQQMLVAAGRASRPSEFSKAYTQLRSTDRFTADELRSGAFALDQELSPQVAEEYGLEVGRGGLTRKPKPSELAAVRERTQLPEGLELSWKPTGSGSLYGRWQVKGSIPLDTDSVNIGMAEVAGWESLGRPARLEILGTLGYETSDPDRAAEALEFADDAQEQARRRNAR